MLKLYSVAAGLLLLSGCASYGVIDNTELTTESPPAESYSIRNFSRKGNGDIALNIAFSGGGTRAAALAYGVLEELRDTTVMIDGKPRRLLDEIDNISSVSGGSFTSAYYGLYGEKTFEDFKDVFLTRDIEHELVVGLFNPLRWFSTKGRTEMAVQLYEKYVFKGATFADMQRAGGPMIAINASDLGYGVRFTFIQEYFDLLCSDINSFPVARAVAASSAVPLVFNPVVVKDYHDCKSGGTPEWLKMAEQQQTQDPAMAQLLRGLESYSDKENRQYAHFVDGGITDNLGLRAFYDVTEISGGIKGFLEQFKRELPPRYAMVISVNASTDPEPQMDRTNKQPSIAETVNSMSNIQLHLYNDATLNAMLQGLERWTKAISTPERPISTYFVTLGFTDIEQPEQQKFFNAIPTSFSLTEEQVDRLIEAGHTLLRNDPHYQQLLVDLGGAV